MPKAYDYLAAKGASIKVNPEKSYQTGLQQFLDRKGCRPSSEPHKLGTFIINQSEI